MQTQNIKTELIVMLTDHDKTVPNALELFHRTKDHPITHWGFKDVVDTGASGSYDRLRIFRKEVRAGGFL